MELTSCNTQLIDQILPQALQRELLFLRSFLGETKELHNEHEKLQTLWNRVLEVAYGVELLIDQLMVGNISHSSSDLSSSIMEDMKSIKMDVLNISSGIKKEYIKEKKLTTRTWSHQATPFMTNEVVGFQAEATSIVNRLKRGSRQLRVVAITGMPGAGKTTLALKVYNDPTIIHHFHARAFWTISQVLDKRKVLLELLSQIHPEKYSDMTEQDLAEKLRRTLKGKRYLIILDDVWTTEAWNSLAESFPNDSTRSRIILTSRDCNVAPCTMLDKEPFFLRPLSDDESLKLLQMKLFHGKGFPPSLNELGKEIVRICKGLPLTIVIAAGLLASMGQENWKGTLDNLSSAIISSSKDQCWDTLELSYKHLPDYLKPCFLYFAAFPEDEEVSVSKLLKLWIAEGFVQKNGSMRIGDVAREYLEILIGKSLVMVAEQRSIGGARTCRVHDLLHDFCLIKSKQVSFFHFLQGKNQLLDFNEPFYLRRLCIRSKIVDFEKAKLFCPRARSLPFFTQNFANNPGSDLSFIIHIFKLLKVLDIGHICLSKGLPSEIKLVNQLQYLSVQVDAPIPSSIGNLSKLETFVVKLRARKASLPPTIWNLHKLQYLLIKFVGNFGDYSDCGTFFPMERLKNSSILFEVETISGILIHSSDSMEMVMRKFPNIRRLKCYLWCPQKSIDMFDKIVVPNSLSRLESLTLDSCLCDIEFRCSIPNFEFSLPTSLRKVTILSMGLSKREISIIGELPNLEILKLLFRSFSEDTLEMEEGGFLKLKLLELSQLKIIKWIVSSGDQVLANLQKLVLNWCEELREIPSCLDSIPTLMEIEASYCSDAVVSSVKQIKKEQTELGNSDMKIHIKSWKYCL